MLLVVMSAVRMIPRTVIACCSEFTCRSFDPSMKSNPPGSTLTTRAVSTAFRRRGAAGGACAVKLLIAGRDSKDWPERRLGAFGPASEVMEALALEARSVVLAPLAAALIVSVTMIVTTSSTRFARRSRARSSRRAEADQMEPGELTAELSARGGGRAVQVLIQHRRLGRLLLFFRVGAPRLRARAEEHQNRHAAASPVHDDCPPATTNTTREPELELCPKCFSARWIAQFDHVSLVGGALGHGIELEMREAALDIHRRRGPLVEPQEERQESPTGSFRPRCTARSATLPADLLDSRRRFRALKRSGAVLDAKRRRVNGTVYGKIFVRDYHRVARVQRDPRPAYCPSRIGVFHVAAPELYPVGGWARGLQPFEGELELAGGQRRLSKVRRFSSPRF